MLNVLIYLISLRLTFILFFSNSLLFLLKYIFPFYRGHLKTFIHTVHLLLTLRGIDGVYVTDILQKLLDTEGGQGHVPALLGSKHIICWGFEDLLSTEKESGEKEKSRF